MNEGEELHLYRSTVLSEEEMEFFRSNQGEVIELLGFTSTTRNRATMRNFEGNAILEIIVDAKGKRDKALDYGYAELSGMSVHLYEEEILFNPLNTFQVVEVEDLTELKAKELLEYDEVEEIQPNDKCKPQIRVVLRYGPAAEVSHKMKNKVQL